MLAQNKLSQKLSKLLIQSCFFSLSAQIWKLSNLILCDSSSDVEIHVCDEVKNMKKTFVCNQKLLVEKMGYFAEVTLGKC